MIFTFRGVAMNLNDEALSAARDAVAAWKRRSAPNALHKARYAARRCGMLARKSGQGLDDCPFSADEYPELAQRWRTGWWAR